MDGCLCHAEKYTCVGGGYHTLSCFIDGNYERNVSGKHLWDYKRVTLVPMVTTFAKNSSFEIAMFSHIIYFGQKKHPEVLIIHRTQYPLMREP